jgi:hypothetical protein
MGQRDNEITAMVSVWVPEEFRKFHSCVFHRLVYKLMRPSGNCRYPLPEFKASAMIRTAQVKLNFSTRPMNPIRIPARSITTYLCRCSGTREVEVSMMLLKSHGYK